MDDVSGFNEVPDELLAGWDPEGDFTRVHMLNPTIFRMLGDVSGRRVLDAGCGQGYLSRLLASRGASVVGVEPARSLYEYAVRREDELSQGITFVRADLADLAPLGGPFDAVVANMVLMDIADWASAMRHCVRSLRPGGTFVFSISHPCFEESTSEWPEKGFVEVRDYLSEWSRRSEYGAHHHRPLSVYLNEVIRLGCVIREVAEPGVAGEVAAAEGGGADRLVHVPNVVVVAAEK